MLQSMKFTSNKKSSVVLKSIPIILQLLNVVFFRKLFEMMMFDKLQSMNSQSENVLCEKSVLEKLQSRKVQSSNSLLVNFAYIKATEL